MFGIRLISRRSTGVDMSETNVVNFLNHLAIVHIRPIPLMSSSLTDGRVHANMLVIINSGIGSLLVRLRVTIKRSTHNDICITSIILEIEHIRIPASTIVTDFYIALMIVRRDCIESLSIAPLYRPNNANDVRREQVLC